MPLLFLPAPSVNIHIYQMRTAWLQEDYAVIFVERQEGVPFRQRFVCVAFINACKPKSHFGCVGWSEQALLRSTTWGHTEEPTQKKWPCFLMPPCGINGA